MSNNQALIRYSYFSTTNTNVKISTSMRLLSRLKPNEEALLSIFTKN